MKSEFKKIAIICASERELAPFLPLIENPTISERAMLRIHEGRLNGFEVAAVYCGDWQCGRIFRKNLAGRVFKITFAQGNSPLNIAKSRLHIRHLPHDALTAVVYNVDIMSAFAEQHGFDFTKVQPRRLQQADGFHARQLRKIVFTVAVGQYARRLEQIDFIIKEQRPLFNSAELCKFLCCHGGSFRG